MPIDVACPQCFQNYRVQDQHAGRKMRCKGCGAAIRVPAASRGGDEDDYGFEEPFAAVGSRQVSRRPAASRIARSKRGRRKPQSRLPLPLPVLIGGGVLLVLAGLSFISPVIFTLLLFVGVLAAIALMLWGGLKLLVSAFQEDVACGLMYLFVPFYGLYYAITRWPETARPLLASLSGVGILLVGVVAVKVVDALDRGPATEQAAADSDEPSPGTTDRNTDSTSRSAPAANVRPDDLPVRTVRLTLVRSQRPVEEAREQAERALIQSGGYVPGSLEIDPAGETVILQTRDPGDAERWASQALRRAGLVAVPPQQAANVRRALQRRDQAVTTVTVQYDAYQGAVPAQQALETAVSGLTQVAADSLRMDEQNKEIVFTAKGRVDVRALATSLRQNGFQGFRIRSGPAK